MKYFASIIVSFAFLSCAEKQLPVYPSDTEITVLQSQVSSLQSRLDSLIQSLQPKLKIKSKSKKKNPTSIVRAHPESGPVENYNWKTDNTKSTPALKTNKESSPYEVRVGAICRDGTRSYATGRGACSHHGGVSQWLYQ